METRTLLTLEEFSRLPDEAGKQELSNGDFIVMPPPKIRRARVVQKIRRALENYVLPRSLGEVFTEVGYRLGSDTVRAPDISFLSSERERGASSDDWYNGAPELAIEVVSPANSASDLERKRREYLAAGAKEVWVAYPDSHSIHVWRAHGAPAVLESGDTLESPELFPGWSVPVADIFQS